MGYEDSTVAVKTPRVVAGIPTSYFTTFAVNENPLSEGGIWYSPQPASWPGVAFCTGGNAFGDATSSGSNDTVKWLQPGPLFNPLTTSAVVTSIVFRSGSIGSSEIEQHGCSSDTPGALHTYEIDWVAASNFMSIVKWDGTPGTFVALPLLAGGTTAACTVADLDVMQTTFTNNGLAGASRIVNIKVKQNGVLIAEANDSFAISGTNAFSGGTYGAGWDDGGAQNGSLGWRDWGVVTT